MKIFKKIRNYFKAKEMLRDYEEGPTCYFMDDFYPSLLSAYQSFLDEKFREEPVDTDVKGATWNSDLPLFSMERFSGYDYLEITKVRKELLAEFFTEHVWK